MAHSAARDQRLRDRGRVGDVVAQTPRGLPRGVGVHLATPLTRNAGAFGVCVGGSGGGTKLEPHRPLAVQNVCALMQLVSMLTCLLCDHQINRHDVKAAVSGSSRGFDRQ